MKLFFEQAQRILKTELRARLQSVWLQLKDRDKNVLTKRKTGECFQWKANGLVQKGALVVF